MGDAYRSLLRSEGQFDVILSEPSNPWVLGVEMLFTRELLEASRNRLSPGGVHVQWIQLYEIDRAALDLVLRTYLEVFEEVSLWYGVGVDLLIMGRRQADPKADLQRIRERFERPDYQAALARTGIQSVASFLAHELWPSGVLREAGLEGEIHTLMHPRLSDLSARAFFAGHQTHLPSAARGAGAGDHATRSLVSELQIELGRKLDRREIGELVAETCRHRSSECLTLLAWWSREYPSSPTRALMLQAIRANLVADRDGPVRLDRLARVSSLYDPEPSPSLRDPLLEAARATDLFYLHYHPSAPFPRSHLDALWRHCADGTKDTSECEAARKFAESHIGPIGRPDDGTPLRTSVVGQVPVGQVEDRKAAGFEVEDQEAPRSSP
jgi:hypothetical protein